MWKTPPAMDTPAVLKRFVRFKAAIAAKLTRPPAREYRAEKTLPKRAAARRMRVILTIRAVRAPSL